MGWESDFMEGFLWGPRQIAKGASWLSDAVAKGRDAISKIPLVGGMAAEAIDAVGTPLGTVGDVAEGLTSATGIINDTVEAMENLTPEQRERVKERLERERRIAFKGAMKEGRATRRAEGVGNFEAAGGVEGKLRRREARRAQLLQMAKDEGFNSLAEFNAARGADRAIQRNLNVERSTKIRNMRAAGLR